MLCPYCNNDFKKELSRKTKCKNCQNFVFIRSINGIKTPMTEKQKDEYEYIFSITPFEIFSIDFLKEAYSEEVSIAHRELKSEFGREPLLNDILWRVLNKKLIQYLSDYKFERFCITKMHMTCVLCNEEKYMQALNIMLDVIILEICGANDINIEFQNKREAFNKALAFISPSVPYWLKKAKLFLKIKDDELKNLFFTRFEQLKQILPIPYNSETIFNNFIKELEKTYI